MWTLYRTKGWLACHGSHEEREYEAASPLSEILSRTVRVHESAETLARSIMVSRPEPCDGCLERCTYEDFNMQSLSFRTDQPSSHFHSPIFSAQDEATSSNPFQMFVRANRDSRGRPHHPTTMPCASGPRGNHDHTDAAVVIIGGGISGQLAGVSHIFRIVGLLVTIQCRHMYGHQAADTTASEELCYY